MLRGIGVMNSTPPPLNSNNNNNPYGCCEIMSEEAAAVYSSDEFRMYAYKIRRCPRTRSHDWTECPYAHRGEKAQRRDPRRHAYAAVVCPSFRAGATCERGDLCEFAHGVFEYWLHPSRYRTRACNSGRLCQRKVCFFAHTPEQLRRPEPSAAKLLRRASHFAYRARSAIAAAANSPNSSSSPASRKSIAAAGVPGGHHDESFEKFTEFLKSLRALKLSDYDHYDDTDKAEYDLLSTEFDLDLSHVEWVSELVK